MDGIVSHYLVIIALYVVAQSRVGVLHDQNGLDGHIYCLSAVLGTCRLHVTVLRNRYARATSRMPCYRQLGKIHPPADDTYYKDVPILVLFPIVKRHMGTGRVRRVCP